MCEYCNAQSGTGMQGLMARLVRFMDSMERHRRGSSVVNVSSVVDALQSIIDCAGVNDTKAEEIWDRYQAALKDLQEARGY